MSQKLPKCAACGESLARRVRITTTFEGLAGNPTVGWCGAKGKGFLDEGTAKSLFSYHEPSRESIIAKLREIEARGPGRLIAGNAWNTFVFRVPGAGR